MQGEVEMNGKQMWKLFKIQDKFFEDVHSIIEKLDERIDKDGFKITNPNILCTSLVRTNVHYWSPLGVQFSFKKKDEFIGINFVFRQLDLDLKVNIDEPVIIYSRYVLREQRKPDEYDNYGIINELSKEKKLKFDDENPLNDVCFEGNHISRGCLKVKKLFDITKGEEVIDIAKEINLWKNKLS